MAPAKNGNSALRSVLLRTIEGWIHVVEAGKGGQIDDAGTPWTRLTAWELQAQLAAKWGIDCSLAAIYRELKRLEELGQVTRSQRFVRRNDQRYWYTWGPAQAELRAHSPRRAHAKYQENCSSRQRELQFSPAKTLYLSTPDLKNQISKSKRTPAELTGKKPAQGLQRQVAAVVRRAEARGFAPTAPQRAPGPRQQPPGTEIVTVWVGGRAHQVYQDIKTPMAPEG